MGRSRVDGTVGATHTKQRQPKSAPVVHHRDEIGHHEIAKEHIDKVCFEGESVGVWRDCDLVFVMCLLCQNWSEGSGDGWVVVVRVCVCMYVCVCVCVVRVVVCVCV